MTAPASTLCQAELNLRTRAAQTTVCADSINELCGLLRGRGWTTAARIRELRPRWSKRFIRTLASKSGERVISSPGGAGYILVDNVSTEELGHACNAIGSQIKVMAKRLIAYKRIIKGRQLAAPTGGKA